MCGLSVSDIEFCASRALMSRYLVPANKIFCLCIIWTAEEESVGLTGSWLEKNASG